MDEPSNDRFKFFPQLNDLEKKAWLGSRARLDDRHAADHFTGDALPDKLVRALAAADFLPVKEVLECAELFARIRKRTRAPFVADLCCGHGLLGVLFAIFEKDVDHVLLIDRVAQPSRDRLVEIIAPVAPWAAEKIEVRTARIRLEDDWIEPGMSVVSAHACGTLSDLCIDVALAARGPIALLPCCYPKRACAAPQAVQSALGFETAYDVHRTYRIEAAGYRSWWAEIPPAITPMNRVIFGRPLQLPKP